MKGLLPTLKLKGGPKRGHTKSRHPPTFSYTLPLTSSLKLYSHSNTSFNLPLNSQTFLYSSIMSDASRDFHQQQLSDASVTERSTHDLTYRSGPTSGLPTLRRAIPNYSPPGYVDGVLRSLTGGSQTLSQHTPPESQALLTRGEFMLHLFSALGTKT